MSLDLLSHSKFSMLSLFRHVPPVRPVSQSSFQITPPTVPTASYEIYAQAVDVAKNGPNFVSQEEYKVYKAFCESA